MARVFFFISSTSNNLDLASSSRQKNRRPGDGRRNKNSQIIAEFVGQGAVFFDVGPSVNWVFGSPRKPGGWVFQGGFLQKTGGFWLANVGIFPAMMRGKGTLKTGLREHRVFGKHPSLADVVVLRLIFVTSWILWKKQLFSRVQWGAFSIACPSPLHWPFLEMSSLWGTTFAWLYPGADTWTNGFGREEKVLFDREAGNPLCQGSAKMTLRPRTPLISIPLTVSTRQSPSEFPRYTQGRARGECCRKQRGLLKNI